MNYADIFLHWLSVRPTWRQLVQIIAFSYGGGILWSLFVSQILGLSMWYEDPAPTTEEPLGVLVVGTDLLIFLAGAAVKEEIVFRFFPLGIVLVLAHRHPAILKTLLPTLLVSSVIFGLIHLFNLESVTALDIMMVLLVHAVAGFVLGTIFLKYTGLDDTRVIGALIVVILVHFGWNILVVFTPLPMGA